MMTAYTPTRSVLLAFLTMTVSLSLALPIAANAENSSGPEQEKDKDKKAMTKTESGLKYRDTKEGEGEPPVVGQNCVVHYTGWLWENDAKGKEFDSSVERGEPFSFHVGEREVIKGWDEGVSTMKVGGKRELIIPADLAYGERGAGGVIPPNATSDVRSRVARARQEVAENRERPRVSPTTRKEPGPSPRPARRA